MRFSSSPQAFVLFMLRDVQQVEDPKYYTALLAMIGQLAAAVLAIRLGHNFPAARSKACKRSKR